MSLYNFLVFCLFFVMSIPLNIICPDVGGVKRVIALARVVFPHPDSPTTATVLPLGIDRETPSTALTNFLLAREKGLKPPRIGKYFLRSRVTRMSFSLSMIDSLAIKKTRYSVIGFCLQQLWRLTF